MFANLLNAQRWPQVRVGELNFDESSDLDAADEVVFVLLLFFEKKTEEYCRSNSKLENEMGLRSVISGSLNFGLVHLHKLPG